MKILRSCSGVVVLLMGIALVGPQIAAEPVRLGPSLEKGDVVELEMTVAREVVQDGKLISKYVAATPIRLEVLELSDAEVVFGWTTGRPRVEAEDEMTRLISDPLLDLAQGQTRELVFDRQFNYRSLRNSTEVAGQVKAALILMEQRMPPEASAVLKQMRSQFTDPEWIRVMMADKPGRYFLPFGWELEPGEPRTESSLLPNPLGGAPLDAEITVELLQFEPMDDRVFLKWGQRIDQEAARRFVMELASKMIDPSEQADLGQLPPLDIQDEGDFEIDRVDGWVNSAVIRRTAKVMGQARIDTIEFRRTREAKTAAE